MREEEKSMTQVCISVFFNYGSLIMACLNEFYYHKPLDALVFVFVLNAMFLREISHRLKRRVIV